MKPTDVVTKNKKPKLSIKTTSIIVILSVLVIVIFFSGVEGFSKTKLADNYATNLEIKLASLLKEIKGVGSVSVMICVDGSQEEILAKNVETKIENGVKSTIETVIMVSGKPYVTKVLEPKVLSVTVVCKGADDIEVKLAIIECVTNALSVSFDCIKILKKK